MQKFALKLLLTSLMFRRRSNRLDGAQLVLTVENNGAAPHRNGNSGVGLSNTRARLNTLYGSDSTFALNAREPDGATAVLTIPYRPEVA